MGGHHFGNRYIIDTLPAVYLGLCWLARETGGLNCLKEGEKRFAWLALGAAMVGGLLLNFWGTLTMYSA